jgi:PPK2 family polyphosphate:nucleotide phosphotransferase
MAKGSGRGGKKRLHDDHVDKKVARAKAKSKAAKADRAKGSRAGADAKSSLAVAADFAAPKVVLTPVEVEVARELQPDQPLDALLRVGDGFDLAAVDPRSTPGFDGDKLLGAKALATYAPEIGEWQERLFAESKGGGSRALLLVIQGMDTSGKGGIMRHVVSVVDPGGIRATAFKAPTEEERNNGFLWRIRNALPRPGQIGVFDRSHYEDVLIGKVNALVPADELAGRYDQIKEFEYEVVAGGTPIIKVMLHISSNEQKTRLMERLVRPDKRYKYNPGDVDERLKWDAYQAAYQIALTDCSTDYAPWHVVPADRKWYARYAVQQLILEKLRDMNPQWPVMDFDVEVEKARLAAS